MSTDQLFHTTLVSYRGFGQHSCVNGTGVLCCVRPGACLLVPCLSPHHVGSAHNPLSCGLAMRRRGLLVYQRCCMHGFACTKRFLCAALHCLCHVRQLARCTQHAEAGHPLTSDIIRHIFHNHYTQAYASCLATPPFPCQVCHQCHHLHLHSLRHLGQLQGERRHCHPAFTARPQAGVTRRVPTQLAAAGRPCAKRRQGW
jgi:hypothetical protein